MTIFVMEIYFSGKVASYRSLLALNDYSSRLYRDLSPGVNQFPSDAWCVVPCSCMAKLPDSSRQSLDQYTGRPNTGGLYVWGTV